MISETPKKYAVVDLEATGAHSTAQIIQIGIVIIENDEIVKTYATDINPHEPLTEHIINLTGITDQQLAKAPEFSQVAREVYDLIADCVFVAHNVKFDANLLAEQLFMEGFELKTSRVDTVELAQVFYPTFEKYNLIELASHLAIELDDAHTAIADAYATAQLFLRLKEKLRQLPKETLEKLLELSDNLIFESGMIVEEAFKQATIHSVAYEEVAGVIVKKPSVSKTERKLSQQFDFNMNLLGLEAREQQKEFADLVEAELNVSEVSFIQAQAGMGKTYAYLLSLLQASHEQVIVSVPTKILQDQLMSNEVKQIQEVFQISCRSIKGPSNYIKLDVFVDSLNKPDNRLVNRFKMQILVWLTETETGDLDEIKQKQRYESYFDNIKHDGKLSQHSPFREVDFWNRVYEESKKSRLLIVNHAYFMERVQDDRAFAQGKILVFDEAQKMVLSLENFSRKQADVTRLVKQLERRLDESIPLLERRLTESLSFTITHLIESYLRSGESQVHQQNMEEIRQIVEELLSLNTTLSYQLIEDLLPLCSLSYRHFWLEMSMQDNSRTVYLNASCEDLLNFAIFLSETKKVYMISATLEISPQVSLADLLGFDHYRFHHIQSCKQEHQALWIDESMPTIKDLSDEAYAQEISHRIAHLVSQKVPILVLFNSKKTMFDVSDLLDDLEVAHVTQYKHGTAYRVKQRFERGESQILLGTGSFWEGVDFVQSSRMIEVITRLPFDNPKDPFVKKLSQYFQNNEKNPFKDYFLPIAILKLKQAIGRTKRRSEQKSAVIILDRRILTKSYGPTIYQALERDFQVTSQKFEDCLSEIENFLL